MLSTVDGNTTPSAGIEYLIGKILTIRLGYRDVIRVGVGVTIKNAALAFAYRNADVQSVPSGSLAYKWGEDKEVDYTNPLNELEAQHRSLEAVLISKIHERVAMLQPVETQLPLKLLAVAPDNKEAWDLLQAKEGVKPFKAKIPSGSRQRREYLEFAVAYANDKPEAREYAQRYVVKNKGSNISKLVGLILQLDLGKVALESNTSDKIVGKGVHKNLKKTSNTKTSK